MIQLNEDHGNLHFPESKGNMLLVVRYPEGDCDTINWPFQSKKDAENLECALFDYREMGIVPADTRAIMLPDGGTFSF